MTSPSPPRGPFPQTRWTLILEARDDDPDALADLCRDYWFPLYCYARRLRPNPSDAEDLTQAFFERFLGGRGFAKARKERGKLRTFLLRCLQNFAAEEWNHQHRLKRGAGVEHISIDTALVDDWFTTEPRDEMTPEKEFDRAWGRQLLRQVLEKLETSYANSGKPDIFAALRDQLVPGAASKPYAEVASALQTSEGTLRYEAFKLRTRYREMLREAVAETVTDTEEVEEELAHLRSVFGD